MNQKVFKVISLCLSLFIFTCVSAADFKKVINKTNLKALIGTYKWTDDKGSTATLTIQEDEELGLLVINEQYGNAMNTVFEMPLLAADLLAIQEETLGQSKKVTSYDTNKKNVLEKLTVTINGSQKEKIDIKIVLEQKALTVREEIIREAKGSSSPVKTRVFEKTSGVPLNEGELIELAYQAGRELKKIAQSSPLPRNRSLVPVQKQTGEVVYWQTPEKSSYNLFEPGHNAKIITYEKFLEYQKKKACGLLLSGSARN